MTGKQAEDKVQEWLDDLGLEYEREHVAHSKRTAKRQKGVCDFRLHNGVNIEVKHTITGRLSTSLAADKKIKPHQVQYLLKKGGGFIIFYSDCVACSEFKAYWLGIKDYVVLILDKKKSIKESDLKHRVECAEDLRRIIEKE